MPFDGGIERDAATEGDGGTGGGSNDPSCVPGQQIECACPGGAKGAQACREDGTGYLACDCSGGAGGNDGPGDGGADADANDDGGGDIGNDAGPDAGDGGGNECRATAQKALRRPLDMHILLDKSGSMAWDGAGNSLTNGYQNPKSRWSAVTSAIKAFMNDPASAGMGVGLQYFPIGNSVQECSAATYKQPAIGISLIPQPNAANVSQSLDANAPNGGTPTLPALDGALQYAKEWADAHEDHTVVVVLATDGEPSGCTGNNVNAIANKASEYTAQRIKTFVIGIGTALTSLHQIAQSGGTSHAFIVDPSNPNAKQEFIDAMNAIRGISSTCEYLLPKAEEGDVVDFEKVNLRWTSGSGIASDLAYVANASGCGTGGWFYDDANAPTKILVCPEICTSIKADAEGQMDLLLGCERMSP